MPRLAAVAVLAMLLLRIAQAQTAPPPPTPAPTLTATLTSFIAPVVSVVNPVTNKIYVADAGQYGQVPDIAVVDGATNSVTPIALPSNSYPSAIAVNPVTNKIYVATYANRNEDAVVKGTITVIDGATNTTAAIPVGPYPVSVAVNPVTNKIYVADEATGQVWVIDGATNMTTTVLAGTDPVAVAVNSITNKIYVPNQGSNNVTVIDGVAQTTTTIAAGLSPSSIAVDAVTNQIYVTNNYDGTVSVIDGASGVSTPIDVGESPGPLAVNPVTNKVYVGNEGDETITVINGASPGKPALTATTLNVNASATAIAVDPATNRIYVAGGHASTVAVIDGASNAVANVLVNSGSYVASITVDPVTNKIYAAVDVGESDSVASFAILDGATNTSATIQVGSLPQSAAVNAVTNKIYVANSGSNNVTVIDGATGATATVTAGTTPSWVAVNPITNQIYVANSGSNNVTVIDGATNNSNTIAAGTQPQFVVVNPVTNKIYVVNEGSASVTVIDGVTNAATTVATGAQPFAAVVNPATNKIYVASGIDTSTGSVTVIDGATSSTAAIALGSLPLALDVNPVTNKIYVGSSASSLIVIDGFTDSVVSTLGAGLPPVSVAVNPATNRIYTVTAGTAGDPYGYPGLISVVDGATNTSTTIAETSGERVAVNSATNKIYVTDDVGNRAWVVDGSTNTISSLTSGSNPSFIAVNPVTNQIYLANGNDSSVNVITEEQMQSIPLTTAITPLTNNQTSNPAPSFTFNASSTFTPFETTPDNLYFQVDTWQGNWNVATGANPSYAATLAALQPGLHILYAYAGDGQESTSNQPFSPLTGAIQAYEFLVTQPSQTITFNPIAAQMMGTALTLAASSTSGLPVTFTSSTTSVCTVAGNTASLMNTGTCTITASQAGSDSYAPAAPVSQTFSVVPPLAILNATAPSATAGVNLSFTLQGQGGTGTYIWALVPNPGPLPTGLQLTGSVISGIPTVAGTFTFTVQLADAGFPGLTVSQQLTITVVPGSPASIAPVSGSGQTTHANNTFTNPLIVTVKDANGNLVANASVVFTAPASGASAVFPGDLTAVTVQTNTAGVATSPAFTANATAGTYSVVATLAGATAQASFSLTNLPGLTITTTTLTGGTAGLAYSAPLTSQNGTAPYSWKVSTGALPQGLALNAQTGAITGIPTANGTFAFSVTLTDSTAPDAQSATQAFSLFINTPGTVAIAPTFTLTGLPATQPPASNITNGTVQLSQVSAAAYSGALSLTFTPNAAGLPAGSLGDAGFVLPTGKAVADTLLVPAGTTSVPLPTLDPGTVAGTVTVSFAIPGEDPVTSDIVIEPAAPSFTGAPAFKNETATGFEVEVIATSTTRDITTATFTFIPAPGAQITGNATISVPVGTIMTQWFASAESAAYGGQFSLTVPFTLSGSMSAIQSVTVTLTNSVGTSAASAAGTP